MKSDLRLKLSYGLVIFCTLMALSVPALLGGCTRVKPGSEAVKGLQTVAAVSPSPPLSPSPSPLAPPSPSPSPSPSPTLPQAVPGELLVKFAPGYAQRAPSVLTLSAQGVLISGIPSLDALHKRFGIKSLRSISTFLPRIRALAETELAGLYKMDLSPLQDQVAVIQAYLQDPNVLYVEPNYYVYALEEPPLQSAATFVPNDPFYGLQWNFPLIQVPQAWEQTRGEGVTVAVIDSGVAYEDYDVYRRAPDLSRTSFRQGYDFVNNDVHANDDQGHGTHVAGTIAQSTNNGIGVTGIAYGSTIMPIKVLDDNGQGSYDRLIQGIVYATDQGAQVINLSLGGAGASQSLKEAVDYAVSKGVVVVAASGNDGRNALLYPAAYESVVAVGAVRYDLQRSSYSSYGKELDLVAPGGDVTVDQNGDSYADGIVQETMEKSNLSLFNLYFFQGTSMATPHVSAVAALLLARHPRITPAQVREALQATARDLGLGGLDPEYGYGLVQAASALAYLGPTPVTPPPSPTPTPTDTPVPTWTPSATPTRTPKPVHTPTPTLTPTPIPTWTPRPTDTPLPTSTPTPTLAGPTAPPYTPGPGELLTNGGFETSGGWAVGGARYPVYTTEQAHSGSRSMLLGIKDGRDYYSYSSMWQYVTIPPDARSATLSLWYYPISQDVYPLDVQMVLVISDGWRTERVIYELSNGQTWQQKSYNLNAYAGQRVRIYFTVVNNGNGRSSAMYVDDVSLRVER